MKANPYVKITGDNLDIYIRSQSQSSERGNNDLQMFTRNIIFARIPSYHILSNIRPQVRLECLLPNVFFMTEADRELLRRYMSHSNHAPLL